MEQDSPLDDAQRMPDSGKPVAPVFESAPLPIVEVQGVEHVVSYVNHAFCRLLGKSREQLVGNPFSQIVPAAEECVPILDHVYRTGEHRSRAHGGDVDPDPAHWLYAMWPALDADERPIGVIVQLTRSADFRRNVTEINEALLISGLRQHELTAQAVDMNARLETEIREHQLSEIALHAAHERLAAQAEELETLVAQRTEKLRETVADLESFSYSVAHTMRTPLRGMQGFARILLDDHASQLGVDAHGYLERIASAAERMDLLIQEVLNYSRVMRSEALVASVDLDELVRDIIATYLDWQPPKADIRIEGTLPCVLGHAGFLMQCVVNILSNAVKFVAPGIIPRVRIWAEERSPSSTQVPWPEENGKTPEGWASDGRVVRVWFEDNGIGLTIVRKALQRLGGRIDFESGEGGGCRFWIELKKAPTSSEAAP